MTYLKSILKGLFIYLGLFLLGNVLLYMVCLIPSKYIENNVIESSNLLTKYGKEYCFLGIFPNDNYVDALIINEAYSIDSNNPLESYMTMRRNYKKEITKKEIEMPTGKGFEVTTSGISRDLVDLSRELSNFINNSLDLSVRYGRYWHGYMIIYRPLLLLFNIKQIRILLFGIVSILFILNGFKIKEQYGYKFALLFCVVYFLTGGITGGNNLGSFPLVFITLIANYLVVSKKIKVNSLFLFSIGVIGNYFDFLTVPLLCVCTLIIFKQLSISDKSTKDRIINIMSDLFLFFFGWCLMWITKFIIYALIIDNNSISGIITQIFHRMSSSTDIKSLETSILLKSLFAPSAFAIDIYAMLWLFTTKGKINKELAKDNLWMLFLAIVPFSLLIVMFNHVVTHAYLFTHKNYAITAVCICMYLFRIKKDVLK